MGKPIKIVDLARTLIRLSGKPADAVDIEFTGLRAGEKLEEELHYHHETILPTSLDKVKRINGATPDWRELCGHLRELRATLHLDGARPIRAKIQEMVPEYRCPSDLALDAPLPRDRDELFKSACAQD
jgi:FlaA1/EpsC-like NDP-sugar epimerase